MRPKGREEKRVVRGADRERGARRLTPVPAAGIRWSGVDGELAGLLGVRGAAGVGREGRRPGGGADASGVQSQPRQVLHVPRPQLPPPLRRCQGPQRGEDSLSPPFFDARSKISMFLFCYFSVGLLMSGASD